MIDDRTRATIELIGLVAVVLSLLLVAYEVRQSNRIAQATTTYEIGRDVNSFNELGYSSAEFAELLVGLTKENFEPTEIQALQSRLLAHRFINIWTIQEKAYRNGLLTDEQFEATMNDVLTVMNAFPGLRNNWELVFEAQPGLADHKVLSPLLGETMTR